MHKIPGLEKTLPAAAGFVGLHLRPAADRARQTGKLLGDSDAVANRPVALSVADGRHHLHVVGATGTGKSTLLTRLIVADAVAGRGVAVLDPKGDLINDVLERLPANVADRLVLLDPAETDSRPAWNVLDSAGRPPELVVDQLVGVFARLYAANWGPRTDDILRAACLTALRHVDGHSAAARQQKNPWPIDGRVERSRRPRRVLGLV